MTTRPPADILADASFRAVVLIAGGWYRLAREELEQALRATGRDLPDGSRPIVVWETGKEQVPPADPTSTVGR